MTRQSHGSPHDPHPSACVARERRGPCCRLITRFSEKNVGLLQARPAEFAPGPCLLDTAPRASPRVNRAAFLLGVASSNPKYPTSVPRIYSNPGLCRGFRATRILNSLGGSLKR